MGVSIKWKGYFSTIIWDDTPKTPQERENSDRRLRQVQNTESISNSIRKMVPFYSCDKRQPKSFEKSLANNI